MARIRLIEGKSDLPVEHHALFDKLAAARGRLSGSTGVVMNSPVLAGLWDEVNNTIEAENTLDDRQAEIATCATAREWDCDYMWATHVAAARKAGISDAVLKTISEGGALDGLSADDADIISFARQFVQTNHITDDVFGRLLAAHGERWIVELTAMVASYCARAGVQNVFEVAPNSVAEPALSSPPAVMPAATSAPAPAKPRLKQITTRDQIDEAGLAAFDAVSEGRGNVRGPYSILMYSPEICLRVLQLSSWLNHEAKLQAPLRGLATITTAREKNCPYLWSVHVPRARQEDTSEEVIALVRDLGDADSDVLSPEERDVVLFIRQMLREHHVSQDLFDRLLAAHGEEWLVDLTCYVGSYGILSAVLNIYEIPPPAGAEVF